MAFEHFEYLCHRIGAWSDAKDEVWPIDGSDHADRVVELELLHDVLTHPRRGGRGAGEHWDPRELGAEAGETTVVRTKIVAPLADAVCFVNGDEAWFGGGQDRDQGTKRQTLGGQVEDRDATMDEFAEDLAFLFFAE